MTDEVMILTPVIARRAKPNAAIRSLPAGTKVPDSHGDKVASE